MRILDAEGLSHEVIDKIDRRAVEILQRHLIDQHCCSVPFDRDVIGFAGTGYIECILETGAPATIDADPQHRSCRFLGDDRVDALGSAFRQDDAHVLQFDAQFFRDSLISHNR